MKIVDLDATLHAETELARGFKFSEDQEISYGYQNLNMNGMNMIGLFLYQNKLLLIKG